MTNQPLHNNHLYRPSRKFVFPPALGPRFARTMAHPAAEMPDVGHDRWAFGEAHTGSKDGAERLDQRLQSSRQATGAQLK